MRALLVAVVVVVTLALWTQPAAACECVDFTPAGAARNAKVIFTGTVTSVIASGGGMAAVAFHVDTMYKGEVPSAARVTAHTGMCGYQFAAGQRYTVFAYTAPGEDALLRTNGCMGNVAGTIDAASYALAPGRVVADALPNIRTDLVLVMIAVAVALVAVGTYAYRRPRREPELR